MKLTKKAAVKLSDHPHVTRPVARFEDLRRGKIHFWGAMFSFYCTVCFNKKCSGHNKIWWGTKKLGGIIAECPPPWLRACPLHIYWVPHWPRVIWKMDSGVLFHNYA